MLRAAEKEKLAVGVLLALGAASLLAAGYPPEPVTLAATLYALLASKLKPRRQALAALLYSSTAAAASLAGYYASLSSPAGLASTLASIDLAGAVYAAVTGLAGKGAQKARLVRGAEVQGR